VPAQLADDLSRKGHGPATSTRLGLLLNQPVVIHLRGVPHDANHALIQVEVRPAQRRQLSEDRRLANVDLS
jgi:hypothetical protein